MAWSLDDETEDYTEENIRVVAANKDVILFDCDVTEIIKDDDGNQFIVENVQKNEQVRYERKKKKLPPALLAQLKKDYTFTIVNDYGEDDDYHLSDEEKRAKSKFYDAFNKANKMKKKHRRLDAFIRAYRVVHECIIAVANEQTTISQEEFIERYTSGDIEISGLPIPKYIGKDKKYIEWEAIFEFIYDKERDINEIFETHVEDLDDILRDMDPHDKLIHLLGEERTNELLNIDIDDISSYNNAIPIEGEVSPASSTLKTVLSITDKAINMRKNKSAALNKLTDEDYEKIREIDRRKNIKDDTENGFDNIDIMNDKTYKECMYDIYDKDERSEYIIINGKNVKRSEYIIRNTFQILEEGGFVVRNFVQSDMESKGGESSKLENKEEIKRLRTRLAQAQGADIKSRKDKIKFKKSKASKETNIGKKKKGKKNSELKKHEKGFKTILNESQSSGDYDNYSDYSDDMKDFSFKSIMKGK